MRGSFLYALEILEKKDYQILETSLHSFFWQKVKNIIRQNKKRAFHKFLFGSQDSLATSETQNHLNEKIETLQNQEVQIKMAISELLKSSKDTKSIQHKISYHSYSEAK